MPFLILFFIVPIVVLVNFIFFLATGQNKLNPLIFKAVELWTIIAIPAFFIAIEDLNMKNDCCTDSAVFSPAHRPGIYILMLASIASYFYTAYRKKIAPPVTEVLINAMLVLGVVINILLCIHLNTHEDGPLFWLIGNVSIIILFIMRLSDNQKIISNTIADEDLENKNFFIRISNKILKAKPLIKYPLLLIILLPILLTLSLVLLLFGQKPDSMIRAFTDTYKHGFSELDYMCENVNCGGHYLCSVAANGHKKIVKPQRLGKRNNANIICNRQLLIANAFENLLEENLPFFHKKIRKQYNKVGNLVHRHYHIFNIKLIADFIYILMKPLEWFFLFVIYTFDRTPENRIARQYLSSDDLLQIEGKQF